MLAQFLQFLFSGITVGATYALAALGFTLIYNASNVINFAQGEFIMLGGMLVFFFLQAGLPMPLTRALWDLCTEGDWSLFDNMRRATASYWRELHRATDSQRPEDAGGG